VDTILELPYSICQNPYVYGKNLGTHQSVIKKILNILVLNYKGLLSTN
jgi:hypothetical protein